MKKESIKKQKNRAFRKDIYLLGESTDGEKYWLEAPSWDCGWYWGFGYVKAVNPSISKYIASHKHIDGSFLGNVNGKYIHNMYDAPYFEKTTFSEDEGWKLSELFSQFYLLKAVAEFAHKEKPGCHVTKSPVDHGNLKEWYDKINNEMIPKTTGAIIEILSPKE